MTTDKGQRRVDVQFRKTKADQQAFGCTRTQYEVDDPGAGEVCVVVALFLLRRWTPSEVHWWRGG